jgi:hypothetical protein
MQLAWRGDRGKRQRLSSHPTLIGTIQTDLQSSAERVWQALLMWLFAHLFYRYRQSRWRRLARTL